jgi:hypothetical protein
MATAIDLSSFGFPHVFDCRGSIKSQRRGGTRLLFLFGDRHTIKPYIRENVLNAVDLCKLGVVSCVGVEGLPGKEFPGREARAFYVDQQARLGDDTEAIIDAILGWLHCPDFFFWKTLALLMPELTIESVEDRDLYDKAADHNRWYSNQRRDRIIDVLRRSGLFHPNADDRESKIAEKANLQWEQELGEDNVNLQRDQTFLDKMLRLWERSGTDKVAILNAGTAHQYHLARQLPLDLSYFHIEQP